MRERNAPPDAGKLSAKKGISAVRLLPLGMSLVPRARFIQKAAPAPETVKADKLRRYRSRVHKAVESNPRRRQRI
jgi:hypothetical protein